jgi:hypothetical protein
MGPATQNRNRSSLFAGVSELLHVGDHDPSGVHLFYVLAEDVEDFAGEVGGS